jgi:acyl-CoA synthetase (AMP-forming)/AMP-acid ligase II
MQSLSPDGGKLGFDELGSTRPGLTSHYHAAHLIPGFWRALIAERRTATATGSADLPSGRPAYASGGTLDVPADAPKTLPEALLRTARSWPHHGITFLDDLKAPTRLSYPALLDSAQRLLGGLRAHGFGAGDRVLLQLEQTSEHYRVFWACLLGGIIPVTVAVSPVYDRKTALVSKLWNVWHLLDRPAILASSSVVRGLQDVPSLFGPRPEGHLDPEGHVEEEDARGFRVIDVETLAHHAPASALHVPREDGVAFLQLSSGSTGIPKCVQITHAGVVDHVHGVAAHNGYGPDDVDLNWLPVDHVVPIITCHLKDTYLGSEQICVKPAHVLADPLLLFDLIERYRVTHGFAPNFAYKLVSDALASSPDRRWDLSSIRQLVSGGEQVTPSVVSEFLRRASSFGFAPTALQPAFGMAEVCTGISYAQGWTPESGVFRVDRTSVNGELRASDADDAMAFVDLGPIRPGLEVRVVDGEGRLLSERVIGTVAVRGRAVTPGYLANDAANREAFPGEGWFSTGDLGFLREGRLSITGRTKETIIVRGANLYCYEVEDAVSSVEGVEPDFVAACAIDDPSGATDGLALFFVPRAGCDSHLLRRIRERVAADFGVVPAYIVPIEREVFPKTTAGKVQRNELKKGLIAGAFDAALEAVDLLLGSENTIPPWFHRTVWQRHAVEPSSPAEGTWLILCDRDGLGDAVAASIPSAVRVFAADAFARTSPTSFSIDPRDPEHHGRLQRLLSDEQRAPRHLLHLWTSGDPGPAPASSAKLLEKSEHAIAGLLLAVQALSPRLDTKEPTQVLVAATDIESTPMRAALAGIIRTLPKELAGVNARHVTLRAGDPKMNLRHLLLEMGHQGSEVISYAAGVRHVRGLETVRPDRSRPLAWQRHDLVLVTGGMGGIGLVLARHLVEREGLRLLIVGRTPAEAFASRLAQLPSDSVDYQVADVANIDDMRAAIDRAQIRFASRLCGAFHLAGTCPVRPLREETPRTMVATLSPKLAGLWVLEQLLDPEAFLYAVGSAYHFFGGGSVGGYTAASAALEAAVLGAAARGRRWRHIAFTHWDSLGMSRDYTYRDRSRQLGYSFISRQRALHSLFACLHSNEESALVGLDDRQPNVRRHCGLGPPSAPPPTDGAKPAVPRSGIERAIAGVWREVLAIEDIDPERSFFELGAESVHLAQAAPRLEAVLGRPVAVVDLFRFTTVRSLAGSIEGGGRTPSTSARAQQQRAALARRTRPPNRNEEPR